MSEIAFSVLDRVHFRYIGHVQADSAWNMPDHAHRCHELIVVVRGTLAAHLSGADYIAPPGTVLLYPAGRTHREWVEAGASLETYFIAFYWPELPEDLTLRVQDAQRRIQTQTAWLYKEREAYFRDTEVYLHLQLRALLAEYVRLSRHEGNEMVELVRAFIREHLAEPLSLDDLARCVNQSKYHFARTYHAHTGITPIRDLYRIRLETARHMLLTTHLPLKAIAPAVGIANEYHLSRLLKERLAMSARELRRQNA